MSETDSDDLDRPNGRLPTVGRIGGWAVLILLLITNVPLFLCMPIIDDAALWGLHAQVLLDGGVPYRDVLETNPPGTLWLVASVRWVLGSSSVALRAVDLAIFMLVILLLVQILKDAGVTKTVRVWTAAICLLYYFSISEWCHCQRDMWLMVPSLAWLWLRGRQVRRLAQDPRSPSHWFGWSIVEGLVLGAGIWIKPMVLVPAAAAWLAGTCWARHWRSSLWDASGLILGGLIMGVGGALWLSACGAWPFFWETFLDWNPRYVAAGRENWTLQRLGGMCVRLFPWLLLHLPALGLAAAWLLRGLRPTPQEPAPTSAVAAPVAALVVTFYVGWLVQAWTLQHLFDYVHAPGVLLAILTCFAVRARRRSPEPAEEVGPGRRTGLRSAENMGFSRSRRAVGTYPSGPARLFQQAPHDLAETADRRSPAARLGWIAFVAVALLCSPAVRWNRLACWDPCLRQGSTPEIRDRLRLMQFPEWRDLERVAAFLRDQGVRDRDVCCVPNSTIHLYEMLGIRPPTRYVYLENTLAFFPERSEILRAALADAAPKYAVTDLLTAGVPPDLLPRSGGKRCYLGNEHSRPIRHASTRGSFPLYFAQVVTRYIARKGRSRACTPFPSRFRLGAAA